MPLPYMDRIERITPVFMRVVRERLPRLDQGRAEKLAKSLAMVCLLSAEYGAGDALAGYLLQQLFPARKTLDVLPRVLENLGGHNLPKRPTSVWLYCTRVMAEASFGDEELDNLLRGLNRMALSGGRYEPEILKPQKNSDKTG